MRHICTTSVTSHVPYSRTNIPPHTMFTCQVTHRNRAPFHSVSYICTKCGSEVAWIKGNGKVRQWVDFVLTLSPNSVLDNGASYYAGLHSEPTLLYCTGKEWSPPSGPEAHCHLKELYQVFNHPITKVWNHDLGWWVVQVMDAHMVS